MKEQKITIGSVSQQQKDMRGWLVGQFFPNGNPFQDKNVEIYYKSFKKGDTSDKLHIHPKGREYFIVVSGKIKIKIGSEEFELKKGEYSCVPSNTKEKLLEVIEDTEIIGVRCPSLPDNKIFLE